MKLIVTPLAEQRELDEKRAALRALEITLSQRESELSVLQSGIKEFEQIYLAAIGQKFDELAALEQQIAATLGQQIETEEYAISDELECGQTKFHASENLKKLYREVARLCHPDLAGNEAERELRHKLMIVANHAYESGAEERLQALLSAESGLAELARQSNLANDLAQVLRTISATEASLAEVEAEIARTKNSELARLKMRAEKSAAIGHNFLLELVSQVERQIQKAKNRLTTLSADLATIQPPS